MRAAVRNASAQPGPLLRKPGPGVLGGLVSLQRPVQPQTLPPPRRNALPQPANQNAVEFAQIPFHFDVRPYGAPRQRSAPAVPAAVAQPLSVHQEIMRAAPPTFAKARMAASLLPPAQTSSRPPLPEQRSVPGPTFSIYHAPEGGLPARFQTSQAFNIQTADPLPLRRDAAADSHERLELAASFIQEGDVRWTPQDIYKMTGITSAQERRAVQDMFNAAAQSRG